MKLKKVKLPVIQDATAHWPAEPVCPICMQKKIYEPHSFAMMGFGALRVDRKSNSGRPSPDLDAFFNLIWHGAHQEGEGVNGKLAAWWTLSRTYMEGRLNCIFAHWHVSESF